jgi:hypothetical protein
MTNYVLDGHDLSPLFDSSNALISFGDDPRKHVPNNGSIIYSVWDKDEHFLYIGISGLQKSLEKRSPLSRMISHSSGLRSGDQFCIYIHDFYVIPDIVKQGLYQPSKGALDKLTRDYIRTHLSYRFVGFESADNPEAIRLVVMLYVRFQSLQTQSSVILHQKGFT